MNTRAAAVAHPIPAESDGERPLAPLAVAAWTASALAIVFLTSNPLYAATVALVALLFYATSRPAAARALDYVLAFAVAGALLTVPLNLLTGSSGETRVLSLPAVTFPGWLGGVEVGGDATVESLVYALSQALGLIAILLVVGAFSVAADHFRLLKQLPAGLAQIGIVVSVGLLLLPETVARAQTLREARTVRGHSGNGVRSAVALALPLLSDALERSVQRAEALDARGFGYLAVRWRPAEAALAVTGLCGAICGAFLWYYVDGKTLPALLIAGGLAALCAVAWRRTVASPSVTMRPPRLGATDAGVMAASAAALALFLAARSAGVGEVGWLPFPRIGWPPFHPLPALACLLLLAPLAPWPEQRR